jgi:hypothetical protein
MKNENEKEKGNVDKKRIKDKGKSSHQNVLLENGLGGIYFIGGHRRK